MTLLMRALPHRFPHGRIRVPIAREIREQRLVAAVVRVKLAQGNSKAFVGIADSFPVSGVGPRESLRVQPRAGREQGHLVREVTVNRRPPYGGALGDCGDRRTRRDDLGMERNRGFHDP